MLYSLKVNLSSIEEYVYKFNNFNNTNQCFFHTLNLNTINFFFNALIIDLLFNLFEIFDEFLSYSVPICSQH